MVMERFSMSTRLRSLRNSTGSAVDIDELNRGQGQLAVGYLLARGVRWKTRADLVKVLNERESRGKGVKDNVDQIADKLCDMREGILMDPSTIWSHKFKTTRSLSWIWRMRLFIDNPKSSRASGIFHKLYIGYLICALTFSLVASVPSVFGRASVLMVTSVMFYIMIVYSIDTIIRFLTMSSVFTYVFNFFNVLDMVVVVPFLLDKASLISDIQPNSFLAVLQLLRPLSALVRESLHFDGCQVLIRTLFSSAPALLFPLLSLIGIVFTAALLIFDEVGGYAQSAWFLVYSIATVGYSSLISSSLTKIEDSLIIAGGIIYLAIPISVVGSFFEKWFKQREIMHLTDCLKKKLSDFGFNPNDVRMTFRVLDHDQDGLISVEDLAYSIGETGFKVTAPRFNQIYSLFDSSVQGNKISYKSFLAGLRGLGIYPAHVIYLAEHTAIQEHRFPRQSADPNMPGRASVSRTVSGILV